MSADVASATIVASLIASLFNRVGLIHGASVGHHYNHFSGSINSASTLIVQNDHAIGTKITTQLGTMG